MEWVMQLCKRLWIMHVELELIVPQSFKMVVAIIPTLSKITALMLSIVISKGKAKLHKAVIFLALLQPVPLLPAILLQPATFPQGTTDMVDMKLGFVAFRSKFYRIQSLATSTTPSTTPTTGTPSTGTGTPSTTPTTGTTPSIFNGGTGTSLGPTGTTTGINDPSVVSGTKLEENGGKYGGLWGLICG
ncbi:hypothetical protein COLO4_27893 [Corchorus olitorius]|uniref:Uncharacterized protein n=1 Tax=Corchorus olitorius TaxID=93759 RepID=A0A1R3HNQ5_9ROSI|nr:hypothetical protein COLO4_27893 [Corchorus olitorius]